MDCLRRLKTLLISNFSFTPQERNLLVFIVFALCTGYLLHLISPARVEFIPIQLSGTPEYSPVENKKSAVRNSLSDSLSGLYINRITKEELISISSIGEKTAERIIEFREKNGPLTSTDDILAVPGIGEKRLQKIKDFIEKNSKK